MLLAIGRRCYRTSLTIGRDTEKGKIEMLVTPWGMQQKCRGRGKSTAFSLGHTVFWCHVIPGKRPPVTSKKGPVCPAMESPVIIYMKAKAPRVNEVLQNALHGWLPGSQILATHQRKAASSSQERWGSRNSWLITRTESGYQVQRWHGVHIAKLFNKAANFLE
jgi:hypothetical protein